MNKANPERNNIDGKKLNVYYIENDTILQGHGGRDAEVLSTSHTDALITWIRAHGFDIYKDEFREISEEEYRRSFNDNLGDDDIFRHHARVVLRGLNKSVHYYEFIYDHWTDFKKHYAVWVYTKYSYYLLSNKICADSAAEAGKIILMSKYNFKGELVALSKEQAKSLEDALSKRVGKIQNIMFEAELNGKEFHFDKQSNDGNIIRFIRVDLLHGKRESETYYRVTKQKIEYNE